MPDDLRVRYGASFQVQPACPQALGRRPNVRRPLFTPLNLVILLFVLLWSVPVSVPRAGGAPDSNPATFQKLVQGWILKGTLYRVLYLGLDELIGSKICWDGPLRFSASGARPTGGNRRGAGHKQRWPAAQDGIPYAEGPSTTYVVDYSFAAGGRLRERLLHAGQEPAATIISVEEQFRG